MTALRPGVLFLTVLALGSAAAGCGPVAPTLHASHYRLQLPNDWEVVEESGGENEPTVFRVPGAKTARDRPLELRIYAWPAFETDADPVEEAAAHLGGADWQSQQRLGLEAAEDCTTGRQRSVSLFGDLHRTLHMKARTGGHLVLSAGRTPDAIVAVVGYVGEQPASFCDDLGAMQVAMGTLSTNLIGPDGPLRVRFAPSGPGAVPPR